MINMIFSMDILLCFGLTMSMYFVVISKSATTVAKKISEKRPSSSGMRGGERKGTC